MTGVAANPMLIVIVAFAPRHSTGRSAMFTRRFSANARASASWTSVNNSANSSPPTLAKMILSCPAASRSSPVLVKAAIDGRLPRGFGVKRLMDLPIGWSDQWSALGLKAPHRLDRNPIRSIPHPRPASLNFAGTKLDKTARTIVQTQRLKFKRLPQGQRRVGWRYRHGDRRLRAGCWDGAAGLAGDGSGCWRAARRGACGRTGRAGPPGCLFG